jgi:hypothetical protein
MAILGDIIVCPVCGKDFEKKTRAQKNCSKECTAKAREQKRRERRKKEVIKKYENKPLEELKGLTEEELDILVQRDIEIEEKRKKEEVERIKEGLEFSKQNPLLEKLRDFNKFTTMSSLATLEVYIIGLVKEIEKMNKKSESQHYADKTNYKLRLEIENLENVVKIQKELQKRAKREIIKLNEDLSVLRKMNNDLSIDNKELQELRRKYNTLIKRYSIGRDNKPIY